MSSALMDLYQTTITNRCTPDFTELCHIFLADTLVELFFRLTGGALALFIVMWKRCFVPRAAIRTALALVRGA